jgi:L-2-hydroxyglutarate oxidase LhgO
MCTATKCQTRATPLITFGAARRHPTRRYNAPHIAASLSSGKGSVNVDERYDVVVVGAGVIGLAIAQKLTSRGMRVLIVDRRTVIGAETSSRNSEVLHAGMHYEPGSLKAKWCVDGRQMIIEHCIRKGVRWEKIGKFIVAQDESQIPELDAMMRRAEANGVEDLRVFSGGRINEYEKNVMAFAGIWSPSTSIVDGRQLMQSFEYDCIRSSRAKFALNEEVLEIVRVQGDSFRVKTNKRVVMSRRVVNAAGLWAHELCERTMDAYSKSNAPPPPMYFARGMYCKLKKGVPVPFQRLVYPLPRDGGLGIHFTRDVDDVCKFGPDIEWTDSLDYACDESRVPAFYESVREYWPGLRDGWLSPFYTGIRPKLINATGDKDEPGATTDFVVQSEFEHGALGLVQLFGFESPGLTSCMAIAEHVANILE